MTGPAIGRAACVGGGVIGGGWVARFLLAGIDVDVFDPHPDAQRIVGEVVSNAERAYAMLTYAPLPPRGRLVFHDSLAEAVATADWIQESVPERLDLKRSVLAEIDAAAQPGAIIGSSTSGLLPTDLQAEMAHPERLFVAHPYNPVYLLPLVELVGGQQTDKAVLGRAQTALQAIGMKGVVIHREIEAFVGDRLLEALWREALWLVKDDVCDVETLDDVIRYSFGLRWAQMGLFQTYRIAGGEAGMRHFLQQFGPCLAWPWTRLTDVPEMDAALVDKIAAQSDAQAGGLSIRELERLRDENLVGILQSLKAGDGGKGWGAGRLLAEFEQTLQASASPSPDAGGRLRLLSATVSPAWIDYNGHMTEHRYLQLFGEATDAFLRLIGVDADYVAGGSSYYTVESHLRHLGQARAGQRLDVETFLLGHDAKRLHLAHAITDEAGATLATAEHMLLHVTAERAAPAPPAVAAALNGVAQRAAHLPRPDYVGRAVAMPQAKP
ncbi:carnitine 3-dehydrogenase [Aureimonas altamirensis DSM 21988]|uniref:L-carnitine dehydrogenase n=2 Tax=Aureimonas altamirensis TaxID=370622 RepID=A0A0P0YVF0_9HYPH|nr:carnitine 3-dehydrogenase [Aureimonas altamirensis]BAT25410.1 3-hydroxyacyl-CoA dehydrogenase NAD-binding protein [Aureimonas altamirensis]SHJ85971.1 carnitine 3-dehydrogenase [Aureimonas altamirensis DSM 21988]